MRLLASQNKPQCAGSFPAHLQRRLGQRTARAAVFWLSQGSYRAPQPLGVGAADVTDAALPLLPGFAMRPPVWQRRERLREGCVSVCSGPAHSRQRALPAPLLRAAGALVPWSAPTGCAGMARVPLKPAQPLVSQWVELAKDILGEKRKTKNPNPFFKNGKKILWQ